MKTSTDIALKKGDEGDFGDSRCPEFGDSRDDLGDIMDGANKEDGENRDEGKLADCEDPRANDERKGLSP